MSGDAIGPVKVGLGTELVCACAATIARIMRAVVVVQTRNPVRANDNRFGNVGLMGFPPRHLR
jgi:hypothetical protein